MWKHSHFWPKANHVHLSTGKHASTHNVFFLDLSILSFFLWNHILAFEAFLLRLNLSFLRQINSVLFFLLWEYTFYFVQKAAKQLRIHNKTWLWQLFCGTANNAGHFAGDQWYILGLKLRTEDFHNGKSFKRKRKRNHLFAEYVSLIAREKEKQNQSKKIFHVQKLPAH